MTQFDKKLNILSAKKVFFFYDKATAAAVAGGGGVIRNTGQPKKKKDFHLIRLQLLFTLNSKNGTNQSQPKVQQKCTFINVPYIAQ